MLYHEPLISTKGNYDVESIVNNIRKINKTKSKIIVNGKVLDYRFELFAGAGDSIASELSQIIKYPIPLDYITFLSLTNGLYIDERSYLFPIEEYDLGKSMNYKENILVIGIYRDDIQFCIDLEKQPDECMFITEKFKMERIYSLNCGFTEFLNRYVTCYNIDFWQWGINYSSNSKKNKNNLIN